MVWINYLGLFLSNHREGKKRKKEKKHIKTLAAVLHEVQREAQLTMREAALRGKEEPVRTVFKLNLLTGVWLISAVFGCHLGWKQKYSVSLESIVMQTLVQFCISN